MVLITEDMVRKRSEHNELQISTLEEISLHQQDIEKIEYIDKWCRHLKILYLQSNLIPKIENVSRLKKLEYLNLALNNVEKIENLEGCESLNKLDLTVNFVGELTSIECLKDHYNFRELFLTGNPCSDYEHYREFVIATLPQLQWLDGTQIEKSERIKAIQDLPYIRGTILQQQERYLKKREKQKAESQREAKEKNEINDVKGGDIDAKDSNIENENDNNKSDDHGFDGRWYTDINEGDSKKKNEEQKKEKSHDEKVDDFWKEKTAYTPESRVEIHNHMKELKEKDEKKEDTEEKPARRMFYDDGRPFNINEAKIDFTLTENDENIILDVVVFKHMDSSLLDCDVQPNYVRVIIKGKIFQLCLDEDVNAEKSSAKRSQTTGHLLITMPKAKPVIRPAQVSVPTKQSDKKEGKSLKKPSDKENFLEVNPDAKKTVDISNIVSENTANAEKSAAPFGSRSYTSNVPERSNSADFIDDPDVPPLM